MKVLQIIPSLASGGAERLVVDLCNEMANQGEDVYLCTIQNPHLYDYGFYLNELNDNVHFTSLNQTKGFKYINIFKLLSEIRRIKPDIIHGHLSIMLYFYVLPLFKLKTPFFYTIHNLADKVCSNIWFKLINKIYYGIGFINVVAISDECKKSYENFYNLYNANLIYNGTRNLMKTIKFEDVTKEINSFKHHKSDKVFVHVGRFHEQKNQKLLIDVFNRLYVEDTNCILLIIGDWSFSKEAHELAAKAKPNIHFLGTKNNVADYLMLADAFCLTSEYEGLPISLLEAISCGCVPICTAVGGIKDIIEEGVTGFLSEGITETSYYSAIQRYVKNVNLIDKNLLISLFNEKFSIIHTAVNHIQLYCSYFNQ